MEPEQVSVGKKATGKKTIKIISLLLATLIIFSGGWLVGNGRVTFGFLQDSTNIQQNSNELSVDGIQEIYEELQSNYDGEIKPEDLINGLKKGVVSAVGDTYTEYFSPEEAADFNSDLNGTFEGIGAELGKQDNYVVIISPIKGTPADKAGLKPGDIIVEIDDESATDISVTEAVKRIRGEKDTTVKLNIVRGSEQLEFSITRDTIDIPSVESKIEASLGIITISRFGDDTTSLVEKAAKQFKDQGVSKVVLDLRGNPGGLLEQAVGVASVWLKKGSTVLEEKKGGKTVQTFTTSSNPILDGVKTVILINEGSASASEIVAGALKDNGVATLLGMTSYGKGSVQQLISLHGGGALKVTIARWYTPNGKNIDKEGIEPDTKVENTAEDVSAGKDPQMEAARKYLNE